MWDMLQSSAAFTCLFAQLALESSSCLSLNCKFRAHFDLILFAADDPDWGPRIKLNAVKFGASFVTKNTFMLVYLKQANCVQCWFASMFW